MCPESKQHFEVWKGALGGLKARAEVGAIRKGYPKTTRRTINLSQATNTRTLNKESLSTLFIERKKEMKASCHYL